MRKAKKDRIPTRAKVRTIVGGLIVISVAIFVGYADSPSCSIPGIEHPMWGLLVCVLLLFAGWFISSGWKDNK